MQMEAMYDVLLQVVVLAVIARVALYARSVYKRMKIRKQQEALKWTR